MSRTTRAFIDEIVWHSAPRRIGAYQWRAVTYTLPERYGVGLTASSYQFRRVSQFGSTPEQWTDSRDHPDYARYRPHNGLPEQLKTLWEETGDLISDDMDEPRPLAQIVSTRSRGSRGSIASGQLGFGF